MRTELEENFQNSVKEFLKMLSIIDERQKWKITGRTKNLGPHTQDDINKNNIIKQLKNNPELIIPQLLEHYEEIENLIPFCSTPKSFKESMDKRSKTRSLSKYDVKDIVDLGGQAHLENRDTSKYAKENKVWKDGVKKKIVIPGTSELLFTTRGNAATGVVMGKNKNLIKFVRHNPNPDFTYHDEMNEQYVFTYQPPEDFARALRYRWMEELSKILDLKLVILVVLWFDYEVNDTINQILFVAPAQIISNHSDLNQSLYAPLKLEIISQNAFNDFKDNLFSLGQKNNPIKFRKLLSNNDASLWSYENIHSSEIGKKIKTWAQKTGKKCPSCSKKFDEFLKSEIAFGHIISQDWANSFTFLKKELIVNHPDNLYLTCKFCNSSLGNRFPDYKIIGKSENGSKKTLRDIIDQSKSTIGDWKRAYDKDISKINLSKS